MEVNSIAKKLLFNTVRVDTVLEDGSEGSGTAFVVSHTHARGTTIFIVTNRHLVDGVRNGGLVFTQKREGQPVIGERFQLNIEDFPAAWFLHPDPEVDLAIIPMRPLEAAARRRLAPGTQAGGPDLVRRGCPGGRAVEVADADRHPRPRLVGRSVTDA